MDKMEPIAIIRTGFPTKFGVPRQSGLVSSLKGRIVFTPGYRSADSLRGLEGFSHIWLIWQFSENVREEFSPTVRPPRLGGNTRMGVFATRSPFRPNPIGLSCVRIESIESDTAEGPVINVLGADLMDRTPIYDIKPYIPYADCHPEATAGFTRNLEDQVLDIDFPQELQKGIPAETLRQITEILALDPRPRYQDHPDRTYGFQFAGYEIKFTVSAKENPSTRQDGRDSMRSVLKVTSLQTT